MISEQNIRDWYKEHVGSKKWDDFDPSVALITEIVNAYITAYPDDEDDFDEYAVAKLLQALAAEKPKTPAKVKEVMQTRLLEWTGKAAPQAITQLGESMMPSPPAVQRELQLCQAPPTPRNFPDRSGAARSWPSPL